MKMGGGKWSGYVMAVVVMLGLMAIGFYIPYVDPIEAEVLVKDDEDSFPPLLPSKNPLVMQEQLKARELSKVARGMKDDYKQLKEEYEKIPKYHPPADGHLSVVDVESYIAVYDDFVKMLKEFKRSKVGQKPGFLRVVMLYGMFGEFIEVIRIKSLINNQMREEEFDWILKKIAEPALFSVQYKLDHESLADKERERLLALHDQLCIMTRVKEMDEETGEVTDYTNERLRPLINSVPRRNLDIFLDNYMRIHYKKIHFDRPTVVEFDREAIMRAAANNPP